MCSTPRPRIQEERRPRFDFMTADQMRRMAAVANAADERREERARRAKEAKERGDTNRE